MNKVAFLELMCVYLDSFMQIQMSSFSRGKIDTAGGHYPRSQLTIWKNSLCPQIVARFLAMPQKNSDCFPNCGLIINGSSYSGNMLVQASKLKDNGELEETAGSNERVMGNEISQSLNGKAAKGSGTTARGRRLLKVREEKRKREYDRLHNYPSWAKYIFDLTSFFFV